MMLLLINFFLVFASFGALAAKDAPLTPLHHRIRVGVRGKHIAPEAAPFDVEDLSHIVTRESSRRWWGFPDYQRELDGDTRSWEELAKAHGHMGRLCTNMNVLEKCGTALVCKSGVCSQCTVSRECGDKHECDGWSHQCIPRDLVKRWHWPEVVATVLIIVTAMLSAAAGMGGGGVYVPLLLLLLGLSTREAVPLSQSMIVGGAVVNVLMFCGERNPVYPNKPRIDYDVIMMLNPGLAAGVTVGVMLNLICPQWLITSVLILTLAVSLQKSLKKGLSEWSKESQQIVKATPPATFTVKLTDLRTFMELAADNSRPMLLILGCWSTFLAMNFFKSAQCSLLYWLQLLGLLAICAGFTFAGAKTVIAKGALGKDAPDGMLAWTPRTLWEYPLYSTVAGFLGGFLGIGGGIIIGPVLLELGMTAQVSQATTAMFVFLSSSLASIQFAVLDKAMVDHTLWFTTWVIAATLVGQTVIDYLLKRYQRSSPIVLSIAAITAASLVMMAVIGIHDVIVDLRRDAPMGFTPYRLCV